MEALLRKLQCVPNYKELLKVWCKNNSIKVSFLITMTLSRARSIYKKLIVTYQKGFGKTKTRWLQNQLKLFHFALLVVSCLEETRISEFTQPQWQILQQAFPNKLLPVLEYEGAHFVASKNSLKRKWQDEEDKLLAEIVSKTLEDPKWNQIVIDLFTESNRQFFRNSKQCRERWLNHLDNEVRHDRWSEEEDETLIKSVLEHGKKWSYIMKCFQNQRTEHMIKNRFLSLTLRCKKNYPYVSDEQEALRKIAEEMGFKSPETIPFLQDSGIQKRLRPKQRQNQIKEEEVEAKKEMEDVLAETQKAGASPELGFVQQQKMGERNQEIYNQTFLEGLSKTINSIGNLATPSAMGSPVSSFVGCNNFLANFSYFQWYLSTLANQMNMEHHGDQ